VSFQLFCNAFSIWAGREEIFVVDASPRRLKDDRTPRISWANCLQAMRILAPFGRHVWAADRVLIFGGNGFLLSIGLFLIALAKLARKPCYLRLFGGSFDQHYSKTNPLLRRLYLSVLNSVEGLIVQTELLYRFFARLAPDKIHLVPGYRIMPPLETEPRTAPTASNGVLRLIFVGHVREEKGVFVLLESLKKVNQRDTCSVDCDFFGPVYDSDKHRFHEEIARTKNATYGGVLQPDAVVSTLRGYDALVFPSFYSGEGHPGVLIEAMMAGIPVIASDFRSIPELVEHHVNGLLTRPGDVDALTDAIAELHDDRSALKEMGRRNRERRVNHDANRVIPLIFRAVDLDAGSRQRFAIRSDETSTHSANGSESLRSEHGQSLATLERKS
jgi:glycosyltransferase involved in cell wall biosynthesis